MAKLSFRDFLSKISWFFRKDLYIVRNQFCIGGPESEEVNIDKTICRFNPQFITIVKNEFNTEDIIFIKSIKEIKNSSSSLEIISDEKIKMQIEKKLDEENSLLDPINEWDFFQFTEEEKNRIFTENIPYELFKDREDIPTIIIGKNLFPTISIKNVDMLRYKYIGTHENNDIHTLIISYDNLYMQVYKIIHYLNLG